MTEQDIIDYLSEGPATAEDIARFLDGSLHNLEEINRYLERMEGVGLLSQRTVGMRRAVKVWGLHPSDLTSEDPE